MRYTQAKPAGNRTLWLRESFVRLFRFHVLQFYLVRYVYFSWHFTVQVHSLNSYMYNNVTNFIGIPTAMDCNLTYPVLIKYWLQNNLVNFHD
jgi:hypothetical protein